MKRGAEKVRVFHLSKKGAETYQMYIADECLEKIMQIRCKKEIIARYLLSTNYGEENVKCSFRQQLSSRKSTYSQVIKDLKNRAVDAEGNFVVVTGGTYDPRTVAVLYDKTYPSRDPVATSYGEEPELSARPLQRAKINLVADCFQCQ